MVSDVHFHSIVMSALPRGKLSFGLYRVSKNLQTRASVYIRLCEFYPVFLFPA